MPVIQDTIKKAIKKKGYSVLKNRERLCILLEDLSPELEDDIGFLKKIYDNQLGIRVYNAATADEATKQQRIQDIRTKLIDDGRNNEWIDRFLTMFSQVILQTRNINGEFTIVEDEFKGDIAWQNKHEEATAAVGAGVVAAGATLGTVESAEPISAASVTAGAVPIERHKSDAVASSSSYGGERRKSDSVQQTSTVNQESQERRKGEAPAPVIKEEPYDKAVEEPVKEPGKDERAEEPLVAPGPNRGIQNTAPVRPQYTDDSIYGRSDKDDQPGKLDINRLLPFVSAIVIVLVLGGVFTFIKMADSRNSAAGQTGTTTSAQAGTANGEGTAGGGSVATTRTTSTTTTTTTTTTEDAGWGKNYYEYYNSSFAGSNIYMMDVNGDDIPEMLINNSGSNYLCTQTGNGNINSLNVGDAFITYCPGNNRVIATNRDGDTVEENVYSIYDGNFENGDTYETRMSYDSYSAEPSFYYELNGSSIDQSSFYQRQSELFSNAISVAQLNQASINELMNNQSMVTDDIANNAFSYDLYFEGIENVRMLIAPATGRYRLLLRGAAGGADGERVLNGSAYYDGSGATLEGTVNLNVGEKLYFVIGGPGGITQRNPCRIEGGFNGGGDSYWSGGGGGSTDVYYHGERIASAAGGGGGQYDRYGTPGRASYSGYSNLTGSKVGGGTGHTGNDGAGAGGGGGWLGGIAGSTDMEGYGGINGYDSSYFNVISESDGYNAPSDSDAQGYLGIVYE